VVSPAPDWPQLRQACVFEDDDVLALNKPAGIAVTGERHDTDLVELAREAGEVLHPVHRIDKVTSGLVLLARRLPAHGPLTRQFAARTADKAYLAITRSTGLPDDWTIDLPLSVGRKNRVRIAAPRDALHFDAADRTWTVPPDAVRTGRVYPSRTECRRLWEGDGVTLVLARPVTGRRHQIRVHLAWTGHPVAGDPLFPGAVPAARTYLHSWRLTFDAPSAGRTTLVADPGPDFRAGLGGEVPWPALLAAP
jgi:tRNA pseudouridine32 synthase/23S rRNA pseudouridine746 synthase